MYQSSTIVEKALLFSKGGALLLVGGAVSYFSWTLWARHQDMVWAVVVALPGLLILWMSVQLILKASRSQLVVRPDAMEAHGESPQQTDTFKVAQAQQQREARQEAVDVVAGRLEEPTAQEINALSTLFAQGRYPEVMSQALTMTERFPLNGFAWKVLGTALMKMRRSGEAQASMLKAVALLPHDAASHNTLGFILQQLGRSPEAEASYRRALELKPDYTDAHFNLGVLLQEAKRLPEAEAVFRRALELKPDYTDAHFNLGVLLQEAKRLPEAEAVFRRALELKPDYTDAHFNLGVLLQEAKRLPEAEAAYRRVIELKPDFVEAHNNLAALLQQAYRLPEAEAVFRHVIELKPDFVEAHSNLGNLLRDLGRLNEAEASCRQALQIQPDLAEAHNNLGITLRDLGRRNEAEASYRQAIELKPDYAEAHSNLGSTLKDLDRLDEAISCYRRALQIKPDFSEAHSNLIFALDFSMSEDAASLEAERKGWGERHAAPLYQQQRAFSNTLEPERRLRIGYVSADFREHSAARSFEGIVLHLNRQQYEVYAYSNNAREDAFTQRFKQSVTGWCKIAGLSDDEAADQIRQDQIDILVDLSGHTAGNRLLMFARRPAPIQINHAIGTGVKTIDVFFTDAVMVPPEERSLYAETVYYLPCALCYSSDAVPPPVNALPALQQRAITFGSFNRLCKVTDATIALWSRVLQAIPDSRLILKTGELDDDATRTHVIERLVRAGIDATRVELQGKTSWEAHMAAFNQIGIALDPFPQGGGITTLEGLLMGIPAITLRWPTIAGRISATILTTLDLTDWIAESEDAYVALAVGKALDREALAALRGTLRERFKRSVLGDAKAYVRIVETQYRELWRAWVQQQLAYD